MESNTQANKLQSESFLKLGYFRTFLGLVIADLDILFTVAHPLPPKGGGRLFFADGSDGLS
jgi:hypothetical protein